MNSNSFHITFSNTFADTTRKMLLNFLSMAFKNNPSEDIFVSADIEGVARVTISRSRDENSARSDNKLKKPTVDQTDVPVPQGPKKVAMVGSGNWGCAIARIIGENVKIHTRDYDKVIKMWVLEEKVVVDGKERKLSDCINEDHENYKYLRGYKLPDNVIAVTSLPDTVKDADVLLFIVPHQFINKTCMQIKGKVKPTAVGLSLIKGLSSDESGEIMLISQEITSILNIPVSVLMGANLAREVAHGDFCEATIGCTNSKWGPILKKLFHSPNFRVNVVQDAHTVELCGALKNVVAMAAGFCDGLGYGDNTKAAVIRLGLMEILQFVEMFYHTTGFKLSTMFESCGVADLVTTCYGGRNRKCAEAFAKTGKDLKDLETELLKGQRLQGPHTAAQVIKMLENKSKNKKDYMKEFPLFVAVHRICEREIEPKEMIECLRQHPSHMSKIDENDM